MSEDHPFQPGVEVAIVSRGRWYRSVSIKRDKVSKVYKTGNFLLEQSGSQQHRAWKEVGGQWRGFATVRSGHGEIRLITDKLLAEVAASDLRARFKRVVSALDRDMERLADVATEKEVVALEQIDQLLRSGK